MFIPLGLLIGIVIILYFIYRHGKHIVFLFLYIDDIVWTASSDSLQHYIISLLSSKFAMKDLGLLHYFLGIKVTRTQEGLFLSQDKYVTDIIAQARPVSLLTLRWILHTNFILHLELLCLIRPFIGVVPVFFNI